MPTLRASAIEIRTAIINYVTSMGNLTPSEICVPMHFEFPHNNQYEIKRIVKEMEKDKDLVPDIVFGGLRTSGSYSS